jgi:hypothetical protein
VGHQVVACAGQPDHAPGAPGLGDRETDQPRPHAQRVRHVGVDGGDLEAGAGDADDEADVGGSDLGTALRVLRERFERELGRDGLAARAGTLAARLVAAGLWRDALGVLARASTAAVAAAGRAEGSARTSRGEPGRSLNPMS